MPRSLADTPHRACPIRYCLVNDLKSKFHHADRSKPKFALLKSADTTQEGLERICQVAECILVSHLRYAFFIQTQAASLCLLLHPSQCNI
jgi:hypothetical protein